MHAVGANVRDRRGGRGNSGHADIGTGGCGRVGRHEEERGQPDVAEHETHETAGQRREETPQSDGGESDGVQGA
jgi:hypothetical protein